ncbi:MAG: hypothetical protein IIX86_01730, partial [Clostridia bacterium]|nr:hypothetical protein [Clostridia bacterium]
MKPFSHNHLAEFAVLPTPKIVMAKKRHNIPLGENTSFQIFSFVEHIHYTTKSKQFQLLAGLA